MWTGIAQLVFVVHVTVHRDTFLIIKPIKYNNFSNLFLEQNSTCFGQFLCPLSVVFHCTHSNGMCHTGLLTACERVQDGTFWSCSEAVSKPVWHIPLLCVQWKTPDDGQRNCPKHVEFRSKNKFEKLVHVVVFILRKLSWYNDLLRVERSGDRISVRARFSTPLQTGPGAHPTSCTMATVSPSRGWNGGSVVLTTYPT